MILNPKLVKKTYQKQNKNIFAGTPETTQIITSEQTTFTSSLAKITGSTFTSRPRNPTTGKSQIFQSITNVIVFFSKTTGITSEIVGLF